MTNTTTTSVHTFAGVDMTPEAEQVLITRIFEKIGHFIETSEAAYIQTRKELAEHLGGDYLVDSFKLDRLLDAQGRAVAAGHLRGVFDSEELSIEEKVVRFRYTVLRQSMLIRSGSSSSIQNRIDSAEHAGWVHVLDECFPEVLYR